MRHKGAQTGLWTACGAETEQRSAEDLKLLEQEMRGSGRMATGGEAVAGSGVDNRREGQGGGS